MRTGRYRLAAVVGAAAALLAAGVTRPPPAVRQTETEPGALPVRVSIARYADSFSISEAFTGRIAARQESRLGFDTGGRLAEILVDEGDVVAKGQILARLDQRLLRAQRAQSAAHLALAQATAARRKELAERKFTSRQNLDEARFQADAAAAALQALDVRLDLAELKAPYDAVVIARRADEGTVAAPGQDILRVIERGVWEARIGLPPGAATRLEPGSTARVESESRFYDAKLRSLLPEVDSATRTVLALYDITGPSEGLRTGALARVTLMSRVSERGFWLPVTALAEGRRGLWTAYVAAAADGGGFTAERREVQLVHAETDRAYVRGAIAEGERVITAGVHRIVPGQAVTVADTGVTN